MSSIKLIYLVPFFIWGCLENSSKELHSFNHGLSPFPKSQLTYTGPVERVLKIQFKVFKNESSTLIAEVSSETDYLAPLQFSWKLGEGLELISGETSGQISQIKKNNPVQFRLKVKGFNSSQARFARFEIVGLLTERRVFADGVLNSNSENTFEKLVQEIELYKKETAD